MKIRPFAVVAATLDLATCTTPSGQAVRARGPTAHQLADLSDHRLQQPQLRLGHLSVYNQRLTRP